MFLHIVALTSRLAAFLEVPSFLVSEYLRVAQMATMHRFSVSTAPAAIQAAAILAWIAAHPGQTALVVAEGIVIFTPAALTGPLLASLGFAAEGPLAGSVAALLQSCIGNVAAESTFAYLQSAGMAGYGAPIVNGICQACVVVYAGVHGAAAWLGWK